ncbi:MAG TPA: hypothetical protein VFT22_25095 [Kofleriaceae bacterium]|nr:hypothetical protein [Kofleriaceae bacterium]
MTKVIALWIVLVAFAGAAFAQTAGSAPAGPAGGSAAPPAADPAAPPPAPAATAAPDARKACTDAMNADPKFAAEIVRVADEKAALERDKDTLATHQEAAARVQKNERHVIYAYAAIWLVAAGFVIFLWRRQQALRNEITNLRRDLEAAAEATGGKP